MYHWIRDCEITDRGGTHNGGFLETLFGLYHFLMTAGFSNIWEIDGYDNHVNDGGMEESGTTEWTANGGSVVKDTTIFHMGRQSLKYTSGTLTTDSVESSDFPNMQTSKTDYYIRCFVYNDTGRSWVLEWTNDNGGGWNTGPTITASAAWVEYKVNFTSGTGASGHRFRIRDLNNAGVGASIYVDSVNIYRSFFEARLEQSGTDGQITAPDQFDSTGYSFVDGAAPTGDINKYIAVWDGSNVGNSGLYRISAVSGGVATLDLRDGDPSASLTSNGANNLTWRMIDIKNNAPYIYQYGPQEFEFCGFGLESPHAEKWRLFLRHNWAGNDSSWIGVWASPTDADFDVADGGFFNYEAGSHNYETNFYTKENINDGYLITGSTFGYRDNSAIRLYAMLDDTCSFLNLAFRPKDGSVANQAIGGMVGFTGADSYHTLRESFVLMFQVNYPNGSYRNWSNYTHETCFGYRGCQCTDVGVGWMSFSCIMALGYGSSTEGEDDITGASYRANPFDGQYWLRKPKIARDYYGNGTTNPTEKDMTGPGIWHGPWITNWITIDSNSYLHINHGFYWSWWSGHTPM